MDKRDDALEPAEPVTPPESIPSIPLTPATPIERGESSAYSPLMTGRKVIYTDAEEINSANVIQVLTKALVVHSSNQNDIQFLYDYRKGIQPILGRRKVYNNEICNRIVVNISDQIVKFDVANMFGNPLEYISRGAESRIPEQISKLNAFMLSESKKTKDVKLADWVCTCGVGYYAVLNDRAVHWAEGDEMEEAPYELLVLDPRTTFLVRSNDISKRPLMAVKYTYADDKTTVRFTVYTENERFLITGSEQAPDKIVKHTVHKFGRLPISEYCINPQRMGAFENVLGLLDAINLAESNRLDGIEQFIQALLVMENVDLDEDQFTRMKRLGAIMLPSLDGGNAKIYYLNEQLDQSQTQNLIDDLYERILEIVGMPAPGNSKNSDSSNNGAMIVKTGSYNASMIIKQACAMWEESEAEMLKTVLSIIRDVDESFDLKISEIEYKWGKTTYEDLLVKVQAFSTLINAKCPPIQAFSLSNVSSDPQSDALMYVEYQQQKQAEMEAQLAKENTVEVYPEQEEDSGSGEEVANGG